MGNALGWEEITGNQTGNWFLSVKSLTVGLSHTVKSRLPGWGPRDNHNQWFETHSLFIFLSRLNLSIPWYIPFCCLFEPFQCLIFLFIIATILFLIRQRKLCPGLFWWCLSACLLKPWQKSPAHLHYFNQYYISSIIMFYLRLIIASKIPLVKHM